MRLCDIAILVELPEGVWAISVLAAWFCVFSTLACGACREPKAAWNVTRATQDALRAATIPLGSRPRHHPTGLEHKQATDKPNFRDAASPNALSLPLDLLAPATLFLGVSTPAI
ncbi:hypothetical protein PSPO01_01803 [Paraphaeosphaeria sporulosa]